MGKLRQREEIFAYIFIIAGLIGLSSCGGVITEVPCEEPFAECVVEEPIIETPCEDPFDEYCPESVEVPCTESFDEYCLELVEENYPYEEYEYIQEVKIGEVEVQFPVTLRPESSSVIVLTISRPAFLIDISPSQIQRASIQTEPYRAYRLSQGELFSQKVKTLIDDRMRVELYAPAFEVVPQNSAIQEGKWIEELIFSFEKSIYWDEDPESWIENLQDRETDLARWTEDLYYWFGESENISQRNDGFYTVDERYNTPEEIRGDLWEIRESLDGLKNEGEILNGDIQYQIANLDFWVDELANRIDDLYWYDIVQQENYFQDVVIERVYDFRYRVNNLERDYSDDSMYWILQKYWEAELKYWASELRYWEMVGYRQEKMYWSWIVVAPETEGIQTIAFRVFVDEESNNPSWFSSFQIQVGNPTPVPSKTSRPSKTPAPSPTTTPTPSLTPTSTPSGIEKSFKGFTDNLDVIKGVLEILAGFCALMGAIIGTVVRFKRRRKAHFDLIKKKQKNLEESETKLAKDLYKSEKEEIKAEINTLKQELSDLNEVGWWDIFWTDFEKK